MAIARDNFTSAAIASATGVSSLSYSYTVNSNSSGILIVTVEYFEPTVAVSTITYNSVSMTFLRKDNAPGATSIHTEIWYLLNPSTGSNTVAITMTGSLTVGQLMISGAVSYTGVDQTSPINAQNGSGSGSAGTTASVSISTIVDNSWIFATTGSGDGSVTWTTSQNLLWSKAGGAATGESSGGIDFGPQTPAGAKTMSATLSLSRNWSISVVSLTPQPVWYAALI